VGFTAKEGMMKPIRIVLFVTGIFCAFCPPVNAGQRGWTFLEAPLSGSWTSPIAMQNGVWPVVSGTGENGYSIAKLTPAGWQVTETGMPINQLIASPFDEEIVGVSQFSDPLWNQGFIANADGMTTIDNVIDASYDSQGRLWTISVEGEVRYRRSDDHWRNACSFDHIYPEGNANIAAAPNGDLGVLTRLGEQNRAWFSFYSPLADDWTDTRLPVVYKSDIAFDTRNIPHILSGTSLYFVWDSDPHTGDWNVTSLIDLIPDTIMTYIMGYPQLATSADGTVATAVSYEDTLYYIWNDGTGWQAEVVPGAEVKVGDPPFNFRFCGIAFDYEGLPVITYTKTNGKLGIAYDPVITPEPMTLGILAAGLILIQRKRKS
jgi:hypothetical protein